jgi:Spy/CpxP family protein refolding chaperone
MKKEVFAVLAVAALFVGCSSTDSDERRPQARRAPRTAPNAGMDFVPFTDWWHEPSISEALNLTSEQYAALDRIAADQRDEISRLERDNATALRDLRQILDANQPAAADITTAAGRVRALHDALFDRQIQMLVAERQVLTQQQWEALQQRLRAERSPRSDRDVLGRRRGRSGIGGRRRPGF